MKKTLISLGAAAVAALALVGCANKDAHTKSLVVYYSQTGTTEQVASLIQLHTGADVLRLEAVNPYDGDFGATIARCQQEMANAELPELQPAALNAADYDTVYIGFPVWFGTYAPVMKAYLAEVSLAGKVVVPFCTFGSGGLETSIANLRGDQPEAVLTEGFGIRTARIEQAPAEVEQFLMRIGAIEGEAAPLPEYGEQGELTEEAQDIFTEATASYQMPLGEAQSVAVAADGIHYCFEAVSAGPDGRSATTLIYVVKEEGKPAEFTRVQR